MNTKLKYFINKNRPQFDTHEPDKNLWKKIETQMEVKDASGISSKWLSKFKNLAFFASLLVAVLYFILEKTNQTLSNNLTLNKKGSTSGTSKQYTTTSQNKAITALQTNNSSKEIHKISDGKNGLHKSKTNSLNTSVQPRDVAQGILNNKNDSLSKLNSFETTSPDRGKTKPDSSVKLFADKLEKQNTSSTGQKMETVATRNNKKTKLYIPETPEKMNTYSATLYDGSSFRSLLRVYKFPGKFSIFNDGDVTSIKTISCSRLEKTPTIKAVWLKGRTDKEIELSIKNGFKNIFLVKKDGRKLMPEAISHYYRGLGVISEYKGRYFNLLYTDKVELILFFKGAEKGDKILIDGSIEATIEDQP